MAENIYKVCKVVSQKYYFWVKAESRAEAMQKAQDNDLFYCWPDDGDDIDISVASAKQVELVE